MPRLACLSLTALLAPLAAPAAAQDARTFQPPEGCEAYLTIQSAGCSVSHHFRCEADPEGWQRRVEVDEGGISFFGVIDAETQWVESFHVLSGHSERLAPTPADPASFTELLATGRDGYDFRTLSDEIGPTRYVGEDRLPGDTVEIDGVTLERTTFAIRALAPDGKEVWRSTGGEFISREWRMFLSGTSTITADGKSVENDGSPVDFVFPGEPGFLSSSPIHGCGAVMSKAAG